MKIGCCLGPLARDEAKTGYTIVPVIAPLGFDYIELPLAQIMAVSKAQRAKLVEAVQAEGVPVEACNNFFPAHIRLTGDDAKRDVALDYAKSACDWAAALGVKIIVFGSGGARNLPTGFPYNAGRQQFMELLRDLETVVAPLGITVVVEPLNSGECNFITSLQEGLDLVQELNVEHIKLLADYYHMRKEDENLAVIMQCGFALCHVHIAAKEARALPRVGDGEDYGVFMQLLTSIGYTGRISLEGMSSNLITDASEALKAMRPFSVSMQFHC
jgi:sugar phosphate isomerase/epimerase